MQSNNGSHLYTGRWQALHLTAKDINSTTEILVFIHRRQEGGEACSPMTFSILTVLSWASSGGRRRSQKMSEKYNSPPGLSTRHISRNTRGLSKDSVKTQLLITTSTLLSWVGRRGQKGTGQGRVGVCL